MKRLLLLGLGVLGAAAASAQTSTDDPGRDVSKRGTVAARFLTMPAGARASAMGSALVASVDDATATYWNPAGLASLRGGLFQGEYADWYAGYAYNYAALAYPTRFGTVGAAVTALRSPEMEETTADQQDGTGRTFTAGSYAFALSYGKALTDRFSIGATAKVVNERILNSSATGVGFDVGTMFVTPFRGIRLGAAISNFGTKMQMNGADLNVVVDVDPGNAGNGEGQTARFDTDQNDLPLTMRIGLAGEAYNAGGNRLTLAVDALSPNASEQYVNLGAEASMLNGLVAVRGGYNQLFLPDATQGLTAGAGLRYGFGGLDLRLDYAYERGRYFGDVNRFTLGVGF